jgi:hypothetical protein
MSKTTPKALTILQRVEVLERELEAMRDLVLGLKPLNKDWRSTIGMLPDDAMTRRAFRLGEQWRKRQR